MFSYIFLFLIISTPVRPDTEEPSRDALETSLEVEMKEMKEEEEEEQKEDKDEENKHEKVVELDEVEEDSMEWELRNTDSVFSELSELSRDFVESVDRGASVRG